MTLRELTALVLLYRATERALDGESAKAMALRQRALELAPELADLVDATEKEKSSHP